MEEMPMGSVRDIRAYIQWVGLQALGYDKTLLGIKSARDLRQISKDQAKEARKALKQMASYQKGEARGLIEKLDRKVKAVRACYR